LPQLTALSLGLLSRSGGAWQALRQGYHQQPTQLTPGEEDKLEADVQAAVRRGSSRLESTAIYVGSEVKDEINSARAGFAQALGANLSRMEKEELDAMRRKLQDEQARQAKVDEMVEAHNAEERYLNDQEVARAANEFATSKARNAVSRAMAPMMNATRKDEHFMAELRAKVAQHTKAVEYAAAETEELAREAKEATKRVPSNTTDKAREFAESLESEARTLRDEASQSRLLTERADSLMADTVSISKMSVARALAVESAAMKALEKVRAEGERLSSMEARVQAAIQSVTVST